MKKFISILIVLTILLFSLSAENFYVKAYDININVLESGKAEIDERLDLFFTYPSHGFIRDIQTDFSFSDNKWKEIKAKVQDISATDLYRIESENGFTSIVLGDPNKYLSGEDKSYFIHYSYDLGGDLYPDYDEFYYNIISPSWDCDIDLVTFSVTFPHPINQENIWLYSGYYQEENLIDFNLLDDKRTIVGSIRNLKPYQALTLLVQMEEGYFNTKNFYPPLLINSLSSLSIVLGFILVLLSYFIWKKYGKDDELIVKAEFDAPKGVTPMDASYILDSSLSSEKDISAMLFYFADQGYLKISSDKKGKIITFEKIKDIPSNFKRADVTLFNSLFSSGTTVTTQDLSSTYFAKDVELKVFPFEKSYFTKARSLVDEKSIDKKFLLIILGVVFNIAMSLLSSLQYLGLLTIVLLFYSLISYVLFILITSCIEKYYVINKKRILFYILFSLLLVITFFGFLFISYKDIFSPTLSIIWSLSNSLVIAFTSLFSSLTSKRSKYGKEMLEGVLGLKEFIKVAELDQLKALIDEDPEYYYRTLSYAIALGLEDEWARKFKSIFVPPPSWFYSPTIDFIDAYYFCHLSRRWRELYTSSIRPYSYPTRNTPSSTHFSGGGFSGGGFSGGGGRSW